MKEMSAEREEQRRHAADLLSEAAEAVGGGNNLSPLQIACLGVIGALLREILAGSEMEAEMQRQVHELRPAPGDTSVRMAGGDLRYIFTVRRSVPEGSGFSYWPSALD